MNRPPLNIARVSGEAFDADQIEHDGDDGYAQDYAMLRRIEAGNREWANGGRELWEAKLAARAKPCCDVCGSTLPDDAECESCDVILIPADRIAPRAVGGGR